MFSAVFLLVLLAFSVTGSPVEVRNSSITLPMTGRLAFSNITALLRHDEARLAAYGEYSTHGRSDAVSLRPKVPLSQADFGGGFFGYIAKVNIGNPPTTYNLIVDTTSTITWVGSGLPYLSRSGVDTGEPVAVDYRFGSFRGTIFEDQLSFEGVADLIIPEMPIGVVFDTRDIAIHADGVLGIGPISSSLRALPNSLEQTIPPITDFLVSNSYIRRAYVGMFFQPTSQNGDNYGELCFGGTNPSITRSGYDITTTAPSSQYWGINQRIVYRGIEILAYTAGVVDSGCTFLYLASDAYERYRTSTGGILNPANGLLQISLRQYNRLRDLRFYVGEEERVYKLNRNAQIWPRFLNYRINGGVNDIFLIVKALATPSGAGKDFVLGYVFLQRFYTAFDSEKRRIGFSRTIYTDDLLIN
ncbi:acid protease [Suillus decipiens]|nr:acid protease [Suillus decipiens]